jgi:hypothetical protein
LTALMLGHVGCAARGGVSGPGDATRPHVDLPTADSVSVVSGREPVRVRNGTLVGAWTQDTGRCMKDTAGPVAFQTFGLGLLVLPAVCAVMAPVLPVETKKQRKRDRQGIETALATEDLNARLRDQILAAADESGLRLQPLVATGPQVSDEPIDARISGPVPEVTLEVMVTDVGVRDDLTLARVSARIRVLRSSDQSELGTRIYVQDVPGRQYWRLALEPVLTDLSKTITESLAWTPGPDVSTAPGSAGDPRAIHEASPTGKELVDAERLTEAR